MKRAGYAKNPSRIMIWNDFSRHFAAPSTEKMTILYGNGQARGDSATELEVLYMCHCPISPGT
eukprot:5971308-Ditylum_brightwellii.AAC.1